VATLEGEDNGWLVDFTLKRELCSLSTTE